MYILNQMDILCYRYYNWQIAGPIVMSVVLFQRPIPEMNLDSLIKQHMPKKEVKRRGWIWWRTSDETAAAGEQKKVHVYAMVKPQRTQ